MGRAQKTLTFLLLAIGASAQSPGPRPAPASHEIRKLIGEYGEAGKSHIVLERDGKLTAFVHDSYVPLEHVEGTSYRLGEGGPVVRFTVDASGRTTGVGHDGAVFPRLVIGPESGNVFRIRPRRPLEEIHKEAMSQSPPRESGKQPADLVDLTTIDRRIKLDIRYAGTDNFLSAPLYTSARAFLARPAAEALGRAHRELMKRGYGLLIHDAYRPWYVTKMFWEATPDDKRIFVANPAEGSRHNRGCAVDLTLYDLASGKPIEMVGVYDEMSPRSYPNYAGGTSLQRWHRTLLREAMEREGFTVFDVEWWHFDYKDWKQYAIGNIPFERIPNH